MSPSRHPALSAGAEPSPRIAELDGLRGIAVVAVVLYHFGLRAFGGGWLGVDLFFVISGLVVTRSILRAIDEGRFRVSRFLLRRVTRLYPVLMVALVAVVALRALDPSAPVPWLDIVATVTMTYNGLIELLDLDGTHLRHMWSLAVEWHFYLAAAIVFPWAWRRGPRTVAVLGTTAIILSAMGRLLAVVFTDDAFWAYIETPVRLDGLAVGCLLAVRLRSSSEPAGVRPPGAGNPAGVRPPGAGNPAGVRPPGAGEPAGVRPPGAGNPAGVRPPRTGKPAGVRPPGAGEPAGVRPVSRAFQAGSRGQTSATRGQTSASGSPRVPSQAEGSRGQTSASGSPRVPPQAETAVSVLSRGRTWAAFVGVVVLLTLPDRWGSDLVVSLGLLIPLFTGLAAALIHDLASGTASPVLMSLLRSRPLLWIGERSYALYIWHFVIGLGVLAPNDETFQGLRPFALQILLSTIAADLSFRWVERPAQRALNRRLGLASHSSPGAMDSSTPRRIP